MYVFLADVIATVHAAWVFVVVFGLLFTLLGGWLGWRWAGNRWWRSIHLAMILLVVLRASLGLLDERWQSCPLTWWENDLRDLAGQVDYEGSPVGKFMHDLIHPGTQNVPNWVWLPVYAVFGLVVVGSFWLAPVRWRVRPAEPAAEGEMELAGEEAT
jgi:hypothetical protein